MRDREVTLGQIVRIRKTPYQGPVVGLRREPPHRVLTVVVQAGRTQMEVLPRELERRG